MNAMVNNELHNVTSVILHGTDWLNIANVTEKVNEAASCRVVDSCLVDSASNMVQQYFICTTVRLVDILLFSIGGHSSAVA